MPVIWAIPIIAIAIGAWLAWETLSKEGPRIVVSFEDAEGLQAGQSQLKFKDIALGHGEAASSLPRTAGKCWSRSQRLRRPNRS